MLEYDSLDDDPDAPGSSHAPCTPPSAHAAPLLRAAAALLGFAPGQADAVAVSGGLLLNGVAIALAEPPDSRLRPLSDASLIARLALPCAQDARSARFALCTSVHLMLVEGCAIVSDSQGRLLLLMPLHLRGMDAPALAAALRRLARVAAEVAAQAQLELLGPAVGPAQ